jgi:hypothetical protein
MLDEGVGFLMQLQKLRVEGTSHAGFRVLANPFRFTFHLSRVPSPAAAAA